MTDNTEHGMSLEEWSDYMNWRDQQQRNNYPECYQGENDSKPLPEPE